MDIQLIIYKQILEITEKLVGLSLCEHQNFPTISSDKLCVAFSSLNNISFLLKNISYHELYSEIEKEKAYNLKMLDGAFIQMMYKFTGKELEQHRLAFFPSPNLEEFQNNPEIYILDEIYADVISKNIVPFPIRFDFDCREEVVKDIKHPKSHLTLGQYKNCRVPVCSPIMPNQFIDFILRNFYYTAYEHHLLNFSLKKKFSHTITEMEKKFIHIHIDN